MAMYKKPYSHEGAVSPAFSTYMRKMCEKQAQDLDYVERIGCTSKVAGARPIVPDATVFDQWGNPIGHIEFKDDADDLDKEISKKTNKGYSTSNILYWQPKRLVLIQNNTRIHDIPNPNPRGVIQKRVCEAFFKYEPPPKTLWKSESKQFTAEIKDVGLKILSLIQKERKQNLKFADHFNSFLNQCQRGLNPRVEAKDVEAMLVQHLLVERLIKRIFEEHEVWQTNAIAKQLQKMIACLTKAKGGFNQFLKPLDRYYERLENLSRKIENFSDKQDFLNDVYRSFFWGYEDRLASANGIVPTPSVIVDYMVNEVESLLKEEFGKTLSDERVHVLDPFSGTGTFLVHVIRKLSYEALQDKFKSELFANEILLLPYYIASLNIEHEYREQTGEYENFKGLCLVDTFSLTSDTQIKQLDLLNAFNQENALRVQNQINKPIFVILGNPPYRSGQKNANDNNKNKVYDELDVRIRDTYISASSVKCKSKGYDSYIRAIRWATDRMQSQDVGIVALITNNSFVRKSSGDGLRSHVSKDFQRIRHVNLKGSIEGDRKIEGENIFGNLCGRSVGITFFIRNTKRKDCLVELANAPDGLTTEGKLEWLLSNDVYFEPVNNEKHTLPWDINDLPVEFDTFLELGRVDR